MTKYNVSPLVAREIEFSTGTIFGGSWCRYFISITLHQCYIEATWKTRPKNDLDGNKEIFNSLQEYLDWFANLKKTYGRRISRKQMVYAAYDETTRSFSYKPYENWATRRSKEKLKNLEAIRELLASHPIYTYDYSDGLLINKEATNIQVYSIDLEDEPFAAYISGYIITYASEEVLFENLRENIISHMDLTKGADDQYYDYSPAQVEAILFGILQLTPEHQDYIITGLKKHLREFIQDDEQDEDMISQYTNIYNAIEKWESDHRETEIFQQLAVSELFNQLNK